MSSHVPGRLSSRKAVPVVTNSTFYENSLHEHVGDENTHPSVHFAPLCLLHICLIDYTIPLRDISANNSLQPLLSNLLLQHETLLLQTDALGRQIKHENITYARMCFNFFKY